MKTTLILGKMMKRFPPSDFQDIDISQKYFVPQSLHKVHSSEPQNLHMLFRPQLCSTKFARSTSKYHSVLQGWHGAFSSPTLYYKAGTKNFPVLLCTTKLAQSMSQYYFVPQSLQKGWEIAAPKPDLDAKAERRL